MENMVVHSSSVRQQPCSATRAIGTGRRDILYWAGCSDLTQIFQKPEFALQFRHPGDNMNTPVSSTNTTFHELEFLAGPPTELNATDLIARLCPLLCSFFSMVRRDNPSYDHVPSLGRNIGSCFYCCCVDIMLALCYQVLHAPDNLVQFIIFQTHQLVSPDDI